MKGKKCLSCGSINSASVKRCAKCNSDIEFENIQEFPSPEDVCPEGMVSIDVFAKMKGITAEKVIDMIRDGFYVGRKVDDYWFIDKSELQGKGSKQNTNSFFSGASQSNNESKEVIVTDIQMPFMSMVVFMVKWVIAAIPAFIILGIIFLIFAAIFGGIMHTA